MGVEMGVVDMAEVEMEGGHNVCVECACAEHVYEVCEGGVDGVYVDGVYVACGYVGYENVCNCNLLDHRD